MITKLFPVPCNVYARGPVGENVMHVAMLLNTPSTLAITRYLVKLYGRQLVNCPIQVRGWADVFGVLSEAAESCWLATHDVVRRSSLPGA
jgi:hypothetical protein